MSKQEKKYERQEIQVILEKPFVIVDDDYAGELVCSKNPPFPWEGERVNNLNASLPGWKVNDDVKTLFDTNGYETSLNLKAFNKYIEDNAEKFKKWLLECDNIAICFYPEDASANRSDIVYIRGTRKETDEEFNARVTKLKNKKAKQAASLAKTRQKREQQKEKDQRVLFEKLKQKFEPKS